MTQARDDARLNSVVVRSTWTRMLAGTFRIALPVATLATGIIAFSRLSVEAEHEPAEPADQQILRTSVMELAVTDYPVLVTTHGIVQPHNEVNLSAQVPGQIQRIHPGFEVGAYFAAGDILIELDATDYRNAVAVAQAQLLSATSAFELATQTDQRMRQLFRTNNVSETELNEAAAQLKQSTAQLDAARAALSRAESDLDRTQIRAPFAGRLRQKLVGLGQLVGPGTSLGVAFAVDFAEVRLPIAARELHYLDLPEHAGDPAVDVVLHDSVNPSSGERWSGKIVRTEGTLDANSLELFVIARVDDPFGLNSGQAPLRIGQPVTGQIAGKVLEQVVAIPRSAVRQLDQVYLVDPTRLTLSTKSIESLWSDQQHVIVRRESIPDNTLLSTTQLVYVPDGAKVEIIPEPELTAISVSIKGEGSNQTAAN
jgi:RND family efflux transporter MFP subunit